MAAVSSAQTTTTTFIPPGGGHGHGHESSWGHVDDHAENHVQDFNVTTHSDHDSRRPLHTQNGNTFTSDAQMATQRMKSADHLSADKWDESAESGALLPPYAPEPQNGQSSPARYRSRSPHRSRDDYGQHEWTVENGDDSKWIHRDKLAKIESRELQAAGLFVPRSRAPSKQSRRDRSRSAMRRGTDASEHTQSRSRKNSSAVEQRTSEALSASWDLRTPEEIAEEEANAYFAVNGIKGGSKIPVAKTSPAPIPLDYLERGSPATQKQSESPDGDRGATAQARSRSASASLRGSERPQPTGTLSAAKRSNTDVSPKRPPTSSRKASSGAKSGTAQARPKTRSGSSGGTRPSTRSGESPPTKQPEGDPPWMANAYKPDPRLPPDQQLLPTVARRLQQERWEKEGTYGDVYDKDFRPLNDKALLKPPEAEKPVAADEHQQQDHQQSPNADWPLRPDGINKSPSIRQGSYSTMPKISDKPTSSPMGSPRPSATSQMFQPQLESQSPAAQRMPEEKEEEAKQKGGCGCCVVM